MNLQCHCAFSKNILVFISKHKMCMNIYKEMSCKSQLFTVQTGNWGKLKKKLQNVDWE